MNKLVCLKELRNRTEQLEKLKSRLRSEVDATEYEEKMLQEFKKEMECLIQEKMAHVEELRQIHADINAMETIIKQSEEDRNRRLDVAKHLNQEFAPLKELVDKMRADVGLPRLPELHEEDEKLKPDFFEKQNSQMNGHLQLQQHIMFHILLHHQPHQLLHIQVISAAQKMSCLHLCWLQPLHNNKCIWLLLFMLLKREQR